MQDTRPSGGWMPLTLPQLDFWEEFSFHPDQPVSTVAHYIELRGKVDADALQRAISQTIRESDILSARFREPSAPGQPLQFCDPDFAPVLAVRDFSGLEHPFDAAVAAMEQDLTAPLDLRRDKLSAHALYRVAEDCLLWYIRAHHIIVDGYGLALIEQRCAELYNHFTSGRDRGLAFHPFAHFLEEEQSYQASPRAQTDKAFWKGVFDSARDIEILERGDEDYGGPGLHCEIPLGLDFSAALQSASAKMDLGWPDLLALLSGLYLLDRLPRAPESTAEDLTLWLPFMSRWGSLGAHLPALVVNILPFRMTADRAESLEAFLTRSSRDLRKQRRHSRYRIEQIADDRGLQDGSRYFFSPLINVLPFNSPEFVGCDAVRHVMGSGPADGFNLTYRAEDNASNLSLFIDADPSVTNREAFAHHQDALPHFLLQMLDPANHQTPLGDLLAGEGAPLIE
ncbi:condensation domain-containing protein [Roseibium sp. RKSG952]|uniref:condensation domain-containing protein n=1 Tax=Roseibium sp. RKSG952 TaxID=2529384 RepID=UPI0012BC0770|nr:condensation domain-containing protein [Roseibium sp. RKSG952]MTH96587.1 condensation protein [Roseibium sp. RKSG952]